MPFAWTHFVCPLPAGIYRVDQGQPVQDLCPDGSYVIPYEDIQKSTYNKQVLVLSILCILTAPVLSFGMLEVIGRAKGRHHRAAWPVCGPPVLPCLQNKNVLV